MNPKINTIKELHENDLLISGSEKKKLFQYENLIRKLLFVCEKCDGALVQLANCAVCKKTVIRVCVSCNTISRIPHVSCKTVDNSTKFMIDPDLGVQN